MTPSEFIVLAILIAGIFYWIDTIATKEIACRYGLNECNKLGVTFLDSTVAITKTRLRRNQNGSVKFARDYSFEFSSDGVRRYSGTIKMLGKILVSLQMSAYPDPNPQNSSHYSNAESHSDNVVIDINENNDKKF